MIDYHIFRSMHPYNKMFDNQTDDLGAEPMAKMEPPDDDFLAMMPPRIHAFDLANKAWSTSSLSFNGHQYLRVATDG